jgi:hypothetical protein
MEISVIFVDVWFDELLHVSGAVESFSLRVVRFGVAGHSGPRDLRLGLRPLACWDLWFRVPPRAWMSLCCECCVLSGRGLCDELITRPDESYRLWCAIVCDLETSWMRRPWPTGGWGGCCAKNKTKFGVTEEFNENARTVKTPSEAWVRKPRMSVWCFSDRAS